MVFGLPQEERGTRIFIKDGRPVRFYLHQSVRQGLDKLTRDVEKHGGEITEDKRNTDVLLVDEEADIELIRRRYYSSTDLYRIRVVVEPRGFIRRCIRGGVYQHRAPQKMGMPGPRPGGHGGRARQNFTSEEDEHLAYYVATIFPDPATGGRMGNMHYKALMELSRYPEYDWAKRHTWHSWRERYKTQKARLDPIIERYVQQLKGVGHTFGHDPRSRLYSRRYHRAEEEEEDEDELDDENQQEDEQPDGGIPPQEPAEELDGNNAAHDYLAEHERDLVAFETQDDARGDDNVIHKERKRRRMQSVTPRGSSVQESPTKRARVASPDQARRESAAEQGRRSDQSLTDMGSKGIPHDDLFGDYEYGEYEEELDYNCDNPPDVGSPVRRSPQASQVGSDDPGLKATQRTLVGSPMTRAMDASPAPRAKMQVVQERSRQLPSQNIPPSSQMTMVARREFTAAGHEEGIEVESAHAPQAKDKAASRASSRTQIAARSTDAPYRNTRARSRSAEPQAVTIQEPRRAKGKGKTRKVELEAVAEDSDQQPENEGGVASSSGLPITGTLDDELAVEDLLDVFGSDDSDERPSDIQDVEEVEDASDEDEDKENDEALPTFQEIDEIDVDEPSDSDDAETHRALRQRREADEDDVSEVSESDLDDDDDRLQRLANASLRRVPPGLASTSSGSGTATTPARPYTRSRGREPTFPSPGTRAREVVDRLNQEMMMNPYTPPAGSRAAQAAARRKI